MKIFSIKNRYRASSMFALSLAFLLVSASGVYAALTLSATTITSDGDLNLQPASGSDVVVTQAVTSDITRATSATGSFQNFAGDLTYQGAAGGTSTYHSGVMGNFQGSALTNSNATIHAGTIGKYSVTTSDAVTGPKAGLVGEAETSVANAAVIAVLGGDGGSVTPGAAYGVRYMNSTASSKFTYGLDLFSASFGGYNAVTYGTADVRLSTGVTISTGSGAPTSNCAEGSLYLRTDGGDNVTNLYMCDATNDWDAVNFTN